MKPRKPRSLQFIDKQDTKKWVGQTVSRLRKDNAKKLAREQRRETNIQLIKDGVKWVGKSSKLSTSFVATKLRHKSKRVAPTNKGRQSKRLHSRTQFREAGFHFNGRVDWKWVLIAFLLGLLFSGTRVHAIPDTPTHTTQLKTIPKLSVKKPSKRVYISPKVVKTAPVAAVKPVKGVVNCGNNMYKQFIYSHESGCRTNAINPGGCAGIGQACPGSKLPCSLSDFACQDAYFTGYANSRYGGWAGAYQAWLRQGWW